MKNFSKNKASGFTLIELLVVITIINIFAGLMLPKISQARAQVPSATQYTPNYYQTISNWSGVVIPAGGAVYINPATNNQLITVAQGGGDSWWLSLSTSNNSIGSAVVYFATNPDGSTNDWTTTNAPSFLWGSSLVNSNTSKNWTNLSGQILNNTRNIFPYLISNTCTSNTVTINKLMESHSNVSPD